MLNSKIYEWDWPLDNILGLTKSYAMLSGPDRPVMESNSSCKIVKQLCWPLGLNFQFRPTKIAQKTRTIFQLKFRQIGRVYWGVVVAQLVEQSLPSPEIRSSDPIIGKIYSLSAALKTVLKRWK